MKPEHKFYSHVTAVTVMIMYFVVHRGVPLLQQAWPALGAQPQYDKILLPVLGLLMSAGIYKLLAMILLDAIKRVRLVKKYYLGASYLRGTWVGRFTADNNSVVLTVEQFEQTLLSTKIHGEARDSSGQTYAQWNSVAEAIDEQKGVLVYAYECDRINEKVSFQGIGVFRLVRDDENSAPKKINGYSADLIDGRRTNNQEVKVSEQLISFEEAVSMDKDATAKAEAGQRGAKTAQPKGKKERKRAS